MEINNFLSLTLPKICLFWLFLYSVILLIHYFQERKYKKYKKEDLIHSVDFSLHYLDRYFITNKFKTFFVTFIYIFFMFFIFIFFRYYTLGNIVEILPKENSYNTIGVIIYNYTIIITTILFYRLLLITLCKKEINKFYLYLMQCTCYYNYKNLFRFNLHYLDLDELLNFKLSYYIFGPLYLLTYRIATLTYKDDIYPMGFNPGLYYDYLLDDESNYIIYNLSIITWANKMRNWAEVNFIVQLFFRILAYIFRFLYKHSHQLFQPLLYFILFIAFIIDLYNKEFNNIYLISFIYILIKTKRDLTSFINNRCWHNDSVLSKYFYKNTLNYEKQREKFFNDEKRIISNTYHSREDKNVISDIKDLLEYIFSNFIKK